MPSPLYIGIDLGTSGCRAIAIDDLAREVSRADAPLAPSHVNGAAVEQDPRSWWQAVLAVLETLLHGVDPQRVRTLAVDGTSGTVLLADAQLGPLSPALMYNDARATAEAQRIAAAAPAQCAAHGTSSGLAKLLWLLPRHAGAARVHTQADWIAARLCGRLVACDANNVLKLGWDAVRGEWPPWLAQLGVDPERLPQVVQPGTVLGAVAPALAHRLRLAPTTRVVAGTTDSTAAFLATGASEPGAAVTSLGSTLVMKVVAERPVFAPEYGIYSQPLGRYWLVGGGSNSGGAVLRHFFSDAQMAELTPRLVPERPTGLDYYPLLVPGERFPLCDPALPPRTTPRPAADVAFFQGLLEGMARIERQAYRRLADLGAPYPASVRSAGGGAANAPWTRIRERLLGVPVLPAEHGEAAYGSALLARRGAAAGTELW